MRIIVGSNRQGGCSLPQRVFGVVSRLFRKTRLFGSGPVRTSCDVNRDRIPLLLYSRRKGEDGRLDSFLHRLLQHQHVRTLQLIDIMPVVCNPEERVPVLSFPVPSVKVVYVLSGCSSSTR